MSSIPDIKKHLTEQLFSAVAQEVPLKLELGETIQSASFDDVAEAVEKVIPMTRNHFFSVLSSFELYHLNYIKRLEELGFDTYEYPSATIKYEQLLSFEQIMFDEENHYISYFMYDLNFGSEYHTGLILDENGKDIPLRSYEDLWRALICNIVKLLKTGGLI